MQNSCTFALLPLKIEYLSQSLKKSLESKYTIFLHSKAGIAMAVLAVPVSWLVAVWIGGLATTTCCTYQWCCILPHNEFATLGGSLKST